MGPKKAAPAKKKDNNPENGGELTPEEKAKLFMLTCQSLQVQLGKGLWDLISSFLNFANSRKIRRGS